MHGEEGLLRETWEEKYFPKMMKRFPESLRICGFTEWREAELIQVARLWAGRVTSLPRSGLGLKSSLIHRKQRHIVFLFYLNFQIGIHVHNSVKVIPNPFCKETVYKQTANKTTISMERMWLGSRPVIILLYLRSYFSPLDFSVAS